MKLIFIRHAQAEGHFLQNEELDYLRELTAKGIKHFRKSFPIFADTIEDVDVIFTSPLLRAVQTAEIVWEHWPESNLELIADLDLLDDPKHLVEDISFLPPDGCYCFVGHEPHLSSVIALLLCLHPEHAFMTFKKGGICVLEGGPWDGFEMKLLLSPSFLKEGLLKD